MAQGSHSKNGGIRHMKDQELDRLFSEGLKDQEIPAPASVWDHIEEQLDAEKIQPIKRKNRLYIWTVAASIVLAIGIASTLFLSKEGEQEQIVQELTQQSDAPEKIEDPLPNAEAEQNNDKPVELLIAKKPVVKQKTFAKNNKEEEKEIRKEFSQPEQRIAKASIVAEKDHTEPSKEMLLLTKVDLHELAVSELELNTAEVAPIQPLVNIIEQEEVMYAEAKAEPKKKQTIFTTILNTLTQNLNPLDKTVKFSSDEEGSLKIDLHNSIAKTRR